MNWKPDVETGTETAVPLREHLRANLRLGICQQGEIKTDEGEFIQTPDINVSSTGKTQIYEILSWGSLNHLAQV